MSVKLHKSKCAEIPSGGYELEQRWRLRRLISLPSLQDLLEKSRTSIRTRPGSELRRWSLANRDGQGGRGEMTLHVSRCR